MKQSSRKAVEKRSHGICEECREFPAVHMHHLTYRRLDNERAEDLLHLCVYCHASHHPDKATKIMAWEFLRSGVLPHREESSFEGTEQPEESAWNLGRYRASGYCIEDVEQEELKRGKDAN